MSEITKSIEAFLEKNNLVETLRSFRSDIKRSSNSLLNIKNHQQIDHIYRCNIGTDRQSQNKLREHLQKADQKYLKRFVERMRVVNKQQSQAIHPHITELPFFKKLVEKETLKYQAYKQNMMNRVNKPEYLDESRVYQNEWDGQHDLGFQIYEFPSSDFQKVIKEIQSLKNYEQNAIKIVAYPQAYFQNWQETKHKVSKNYHDKLCTRLPPHLFFDPKTKQNNKNYPVEYEGIAFGSFDLKVIYDREKTGFEEDKDFTIVINEVLAGRYQIVSMLGQAQFSKAIEVKDLTNQKRYCLKVILNDKDYLDQSIDEIKLLKFIKANCNPDQHYLLQMHDFFYHKQHLMILTELLKENLYDAYKTNQQYFNLRTIQILTKQMLTALAKLHELHIIHCDLKPENILIKSYSNKIIKIIDVGSSIFFHDEPQFYVQTRSYRAPEVILGCPYTEKIDIWSIGCIVAELFTGQVLFESNNVVGLLARVQGLRGPWPSWMIEKGKQVSKYFTKQLILYEQVQEEIAIDDIKQKQKTGFCRVLTPKMTNLKSRIKCNNKNFLDFLSKCLKIDPSIRISAKQGLQHPFITQLIEE